jgi:DNA-binding MarR family transcriptional regulator
MGENSDQLTAVYGIPVGAEGTAMGAPPNADRALGSLRSVIRTFNVLTKKLERRLGLSGSQLEVLECLRDHPGLSLSDLATRSSTDLSTMSVVVGRLVERGLVRRQQAADDKRRGELTLTAEGEDVLREAPPSVPSRLRAGFAKLAESERHALTTLLYRWVTAAGMRR